MDINELDSKFSFDFLPKTKFNTFANPDLNISAYPGTNGLVWICEDFLTETQCDTIIANSEKAGFEHLEYRNSSRVIGFDSNCVLTDLITNNFNSEYLTQRLNKKPSSPYGFYSNYIKWNPIEPNINKCFRINKYNESQEFKFHRDAQYTQSHLVKSSHSILIYLNDGFDGGETVFRFPKKQYVNPGLTIKQELELIGSDYTDIVIQPKRGQMIIFDQRLLHAGQPVKSGTKYVLRTDLIRTGVIDLDNKKVPSRVPSNRIPVCGDCVNEGNENNSNPSDPLVEPIEKLATPLEKQIYALAQGIFRQAQLTELNKSSKSNTCELYEICIGLRQTPHLITEYPKALESLLTNLLLEPQSISKFLKLIERNGLEFKYSYTLPANKLDLLKIAYITSIYMSTSDLTDYPSFIEKVSNIYSAFGLQSIIEKESDQNVSQASKKNKLIPYVVLLSHPDGPYTETKYGFGTLEEIKNEILKKISNYVYHKIVEFYKTNEPTIELIENLFECENMEYRMIQKSWAGRAFINNKWRYFTPTNQDILDYIVKSKHKYEKEEEYEEDFNENLSDISESESEHSEKSESNNELDNESEDETNESEESSLEANIPQTYDDLTEQIEEDRYDFCQETNFFPQIAKYLDQDLNEGNFNFELKNPIDPFDLLCSIQAQGYGFDCDGCELCEPDSCFGNEDNETGYYGEEINMNWNPNFSMKFLDLKVNPELNQISGQMQIETTAHSFNHASCNCETHVVYGDDTTMYSRVKLTSDFTFDQTEQILTIKLIPKIIM